MVLQKQIYSRFKKINYKVVNKLNLLKETVTILSQLIRDQYILLCMLRSNL